MGEAIIIHYEKQRSNGKRMEKEWQNAGKYFGYKMVQRGSAWFKIWVGLDRLG